MIPSDLNPEGFPPEKPFDLASLALPDAAIVPDGIYLDMPEERYFGAFALSYSGIKDLRSNPYLWWVKSPLNPNQAEALAEETQSDAKDLGKSFDARIICGKEYFEAHYAPAITHADYPKSLRTADDLKDWLENRDLPKSGKTKQILIDRVLEADPTAQIFDVILDGYIKANKGKEFVDCKWWRKIQLAAQVIESHPYLGKVLTDGIPQLSVFWTCEKTGIPCRARIDYTRKKVLVDLKTLLIPDGMGLDQTIGREIGRRRYYIQSQFYREAIRQVPRLLRARKIFGLPPDGFLEALAKNVETIEWLWIFQTKGPAPIARGILLEQYNVLCTIGDGEVDTAKHLFRSLLDKYGSLPWLDPEPIKALDESFVPAWSMI